MTSHFPHKYRIDVNPALYRIIKMRWKEDVDDNPNVEYVPFAMWLEDFLAEAVGDYDIKKQAVEGLALENRLKNQE